LQREAEIRRTFEFACGPVFAHLILADEINRTPPKTQAALLEAMQEMQVTVGGKTLPLAPPFVVYATQNPIEHEGTYPLPEAQLDRFFFNLIIDYPSLEEEREIVALDASSSMGFGQRISKLEFASFFVAAVFYLVVKGRDRVSL
jgi:MoxR-like ATPase